MSKRASERVPKKMRKRESERVPKHSEQLKASERVSNDQCGQRDDELVALYLKPRFQAVYTYNDAFPAPCAKAPLLNSSW